MSVSEGSTAALSCCGCRCVGGCGRREVRLGFGDVGGCFRYALQLPAQDAVQTGPSRRRVLSGLLESISSTHSFPLGRAAGTVEVNPLQQTREAAQTRTSSEQPQTRAHSTDPHASAPSSRSPRVLHEEPFLTPRKAQGPCPHRWSVPVLTSNTLVSVANTSMRRGDSKEAPPLSAATERMSTSRSRSSSMDSGAVVTSAGGAAPPLLREQLRSGEMTSRRTDQCGGETVYPPGGQSFRCCEACCCASGAHLPHFTDVSKQIAQREQWRWWLQLLCPTSASPTDVKPKVLPKGTTTLSSTAPENRSDCEGDDAARSTAHRKSPLKSTPTLTCATNETENRKEKVDREAPALRASAKKCTTELSWDHRCNLQRSGPTGWRSPPPPPSPSSSFSSSSREGRDAGGRSRMGRSSDGEAADFAEMSFSGASYPFLASQTTDSDGTRDECTTIGTMEKAPCVAVKETECDGDDDQDDSSDVDSSEETEGRDEYRAETNTFSTTTSTDIPIELRWGLHAHQLRELMALHQLSFPITYDAGYYDWFWTHRTSTLVVYTTEDGLAQLQRESMEPYSNNALPKTTSAAGGTRSCNTTTPLREATRTPPSRRRSRQDRNARHERRRPVPPATRCARGSSPPTAQASPGKKKKKKKIDAAVSQRFPQSVQEARRTLMVLEQRAQSPRRASSSSSSSCVLSDTNQKMPTSSSVVDVWAALRDPEQPLLSEILQTQRRRQCTVMVGFISGQPTYVPCTHPPSTNNISTTPGCAESTCTASCEEVLPQQKTASWLDSVLGLSGLSTSHASEEPLEEHGPPLHFFLNPSYYIGGLAVHPLLRHCGVGGVLLQHFCTYFYQQCPVVLSEYLHHRVQIRVLEEEGAVPATQEEGGEDRSGPTHGSTVSYELRLVDPSDPDPAERAVEHHQYSFCAGSERQHHTSSTSRVTPSSLTIAVAASAAATARRAELGGEGPPPASSYLHSGIYPTQSRSSSNDANDVVVEWGYRSGIWLHCLASDKALLRFYAKRGFQLVRLLEGYYEFDDRQHTSALLCYCCPPNIHTLHDGSRRALLEGETIVYQALRQSAKELGVALQARAGGTTVAATSSLNADADRDSFQGAVMPAGNGVIHRTASAFDPLRHNSTTTAVELWCKPHLVPFVRNVELVSCKDAQQCLEEAVCTAGGANHTMQYKKLSQERSGRSLTRSLSRERKTGAMEDVLEVSCGGEPEHTSWWGSIQRYAKSWGPAMQWLRWWRWASTRATAGHNNEEERPTRDAVSFYPPDNAGSKKSSGKSKRKKN